MVACGTHTELSVKVGYPSVNLRLTGGGIADILLVTGQRSFSRIFQEYCNISRSLLHEPKLTLKLLHMLQYVLHQPIIDPTPRAKKRAGGVSVSYSHA